HGESVEGLPRRLLPEHRRRGLPGSHHLAQGNRGEVSVLRHYARWYLRNLSRRSELNGRRALPPGVLQGRGVELRLPRQPHGQDLVERAVDGLAPRTRLRGIVEHGQCEEPEGP